MPKGFVKSIGLTCIACGDTGRSSKGDTCQPCLANGRIKYCLGCDKQASLSYKDNPWCGDAWCRDLIIEAIKIAEATTDGKNS